MTPDPMPGDGEFSVNARPVDPGAATQITVKFNNPSFIPIDGSITFEVEDDLGVPSTIDERQVSIDGMGAEDADDTGSAQVAAPASVIVEYNAPAERHKITLFIADMSTGSSDAEASDDGLAEGQVAVTFRQGSGITNRTEGSIQDGDRGADDWFVYTSESPDMVKIHDHGMVYDVPFLVELSSYADKRGDEITATGKGFKNGTTTYFLLDNDGTDGFNLATDTVICKDDAVGGNDIAVCTFTLTNPPFAPGEGNMINAVDGRGNAAQNPVEIELEPSLDVSPSRGNPGDSINVQLQDFPPQDTVTQIEFARTVDFCGGDSSMDCPNYGTVGTNGNLSFSFIIPNGLPAGAQDLRIHTGNADDNVTFIVGAGELQVASTNVLANQRISVSGSGFTKSSNRDPAYIGTPPSGEDSSCPANYGGEITLGGEPIAWDRVNDGDSIEVTSGGTWSAAIDLPINSSTTEAGTRELKITDCLRGVGTRDLSFSAREVTMTPEEGGVGSDVVITGRNFPVSNDNGTDIEIMVKYDADGEIDDDDVEPDALGNFTVILEVPEDANIPSNNTVSVDFKQDRATANNSDTIAGGGPQVLDTFTHRVPQGTIVFDSNRGGEGSTITITANGFNRYTSVKEITFDGRDITPLPRPQTDTNGNGEFDIRIPGTDPGVYIIRVEIEEVVATQTYTVVEGSGAADAAVETVLANVISAAALDRVFRFDNSTKSWEWYISDPAFSASNNLAGLSSGDLVYIKVTEDVTADILGASTTLTCTNAGTDTEDCWNLIAIP